MATSREGDGSRNAPTGEMLSPANKKPCRACTDFKSFTASKGFGFKKKTTDDVSFVLFSNAKCRNIIHVLHQLITATGSFSLKMMATPSPVHGPATVDRLPTTMWACVQHMYAMFTHAENNGMIPVGIIARPKGVPPKATRPKDGLFRLHTSWIYLSYAGFDCLAAILCH